MLVQRERCNFKCTK